MRSRKIAGVKVDFDITYEDVLSKVESLLKSPGSHYLWTVNPEFVMVAQKDREFRDLLNESAISTPDGVGLIMADRYMRDAAKIKRDVFFPLKAFIKGTALGIKILFGLEKVNQGVTGVDLIYKLSENAAEKGQTILLLGGWEKNFLGQLKKNHGNVAIKAAENLKARYPMLKVIGATSAFRKTPEDDEQTLNYISEQMARNQINEIDLLFVAYGHGNQEKWLKRNLHKIPAKVGIGVGGTFDYVAGLQKRAPGGFIRRNVEWLYRLFTQPWRLGRTLKAFPLFPFLVYYLSVTKSKMP